MLVRAAAASGATDGSGLVVAAQRPLLTPVTLTHTTDVVAAAGAAVRAAVTRRHRTMTSFDNFVPKNPA